MEKFRWAFIGCGIMANIAARVITGSGRHEIVSVQNRTHEKAEEFAKTYGGRACRSIEEAITAEGVQGVYIATTCETHAETMLLCIQHHKAVLCEKPFTVNTAEAEKVFDLAAKEHVYVAEAMWTWFNPTALKVKEWIHSGEIGQIERVDCTHALPALKFYKSDRLKDPQRTGGAVMDTGVYPIRYCLELFGMPAGIHCKGRITGGVDLSDTIKLDHDGFACTLIISIEKFKGESFIIRGEKGTISVPWFHIARKATLSKGYFKRVVFQDGAGSIEELYLPQFDAVADEIVQGKPESQFVPAVSTLNTMRILDECRRQIGLVFPGEK